MWGVSFVCLFFCACTDTGQETEIKIYTLFPCGSVDKEPAYNVGDLSSHPGVGRPPGEDHGNPLQHSGLENSIDCIVHGVAKSQTWLSECHFHFFQIICRYLWSSFSKESKTFILLLLPGDLFCCSDYGFWIQVDSVLLPLPTNIYIYLKVILRLRCEKV